MSRLARSTAFRLALAAVAMGAIILVGIVSHLLLRTNQLLTAQLHENARTEMQDLLNQAQLRGLEGLSAIIAERASHQTSRRYLLIDTSGRVLAGDLPPDATPDSQTGLLAFSERIGGSDVEQHAVGQVASLAEGGRLVVARDLGEQLALTRHMQLLTLLGAALLTTLGLGSGALIARDHARRLDAIAEQATAIMAGEMSRRLPLDGSGDEFDRLSSNLNVMLARIEELMTALREVSDNIAHDLRTPLTRLRNRAEAALRDPAGGPTHRVGLEKAIEEADELIKTFNALLLIARLEGGASDDTMQPIDISAIVSDVSELYHPVAEEAGFDLAISVPPGLVARANRQLLGQAIANLVDNAIKYAATGSQDRRIAISAVNIGETIEICVTDHGPGIAQHDRARALKRFVRLEKSRSKPGTGLGLSLVAAVARLHSGVIRIEDNDPGLRVVLALPALPDQAIGTMS